MNTEDNDQESQDQTDDAGESAFEGNDGGGGDETAYIASEPRKPLSKGTVAMFVVLAAAGAGTYLMYARTGPQSASASTDPKAQKVIKQYISDRDRNFIAMQKMLRDTEAVVAQFLNYPSIKQVPLSGLAANPFRLNEPTEQAVAPRVDDAKEKRKREEERVAILNAVNALQLQSVMRGARNSCMVNNALYTEGQQVDGFTIEKISTNSVIVRNGAYRFELRMQR
jgi:hypothetical protein